MDDAQEAQRVNTLFERDDQTAPSGAVFVELTGVYGGCRNHRQAKLLNSLHYGGDGGYGGLSPSTPRQKILSGKVFCGGGDYYSTGIYEY